MNQKVILYLCLFAFGIALIFATLNIPPRYFAVPSPFLEALVVPVTSDLGI